MLRTMSQEHHFNLMRAFPTWDYYQRGPNDYNFEEIEELMQYCDEFEIKVLMGVVLETAPYWLEQAHPETRWVDSTGHAVHLRGNSSHITGGFPGLCLDWEPVQVAARAYIRELDGRGIEASLHVRVGCLERACFAGGGRSKYMGNDAGDVVLLLRADDRRIPRMAQAAL